MLVPRHFLANSYQSGLSPVFLKKPRPIRDIDSNDVMLVKNLLERQANNPFVSNRKARNLAELKPQVDRGQFWH